MPFHVARQDQLPRFSFAARPAHSEFPEHHLQWTKVRERRLQQVEADKRRKPKPVFALIVREHEAQEDERAGEPADKHMHFHIKNRATKLEKVTNRFPWIGANREGLVVADQNRQIARD